MKKKILIVTTILNTVDFVVDHIKLLENMGYEVWIATSFCKDFEDEIHERLRDNKFIDIGFSRNPFSIDSFRALKQLEKLLSENDFAGIHCHSPIASFIVRFAGRRIQQKNVIYTAHGFHFYKGAPLKNWLVYYPLEMLAGCWSDKIITINREDYENSLKFRLKDGGKCYHINGVGVDLDKFKSENLIYRVREGVKTDFIIITLGELNNNKNQIQTLKALKILKDKERKIKYYIVGIGPNKENLEKYCMENNLQENVIFTDIIHSEYIPEIISMADLVISTSKREGLGLNLIEGIASGKPVIGTDNRGHREIIIDGVNGVFVGIGDYTQLAEKIENIIDKKQIWSAEYTVQKFSKKIILEEMKKIYEEL
ncbi:MAG: glycosyltransferase family 4 protein [Fusobacteriaceae bacterium]